MRPASRNVQELVMIKKERKKERKKEKTEIESKENRKNRCQSVDERRLYEKYLIKKILNL